MTDRAPAASDLLQRVTDSLSLMIVEVKDPGAEALAALHEAQRYLRQPKPQPNASDIESAARLLDAMRERCARLAWSGSLEYPSGATFESGVRTGRIDASKAIREAK